MNLPQPQEPEMLETLLWSTISFALYLGLLRWVALILA